MRRPRILDEHQVAEIERQLPPIGYRVNAKCFVQMYHDTRDLIATIKTLRARLALGEPEPSAPPSGSTPPAGGLLSPDSASGATGATLPPDAEIIAAAREWAQFGPDVEQARAYLAQPGSRKANKASVRLLRALDALSPTEPPR